MVPSLRRFGALAMATPYPDATRPASSIGQTCRTAWLEKEMRPDQASPLQVQLCCHLQRGRAPPELSERGAFPRDFAQSRNLLASREPKRSSQPVEASV